MGKSSQQGQTSDLILLNPIAFHFIQLFLFSTWALPCWAMVAAGPRHSDQALWESTGTFAVDLLGDG